MKREIILIAALCLCLMGCGKDTQVYIPEEEAAEIRDGTVVYIPVDPDGPTEAETQPAEAETQPGETEPEQKNSATISKNTSTSSNKGSSGNKNNSTNKGTITGSSQKPTATEPPATEPPATQSQTTVTIPMATEPPATEPATTEPPGTEPAETEPVVTEPAVTEPLETQPPETQPPLYDISGYTVGILEYAMLEQINAHRAEAGLSPLALDEQLSAIASCRSYEVSLVWSHTRPDGRGYATVLDDYGYGAGGVEELLIYTSGVADGTAMADRWMASDTHREILLGGWGVAGIGVYDANGFTYVTCLLIG